MLSGLTSRLPQSVAAAEVGGEGDPAPQSAHLTSVFDKITKTPVKNFCYVDKKNVNKQGEKAAKESSETTTHIQRGYQ